MAQSALSLSRLGFAAFRVSWRLVDDGAAAPPSPAMKAWWWRFVDAASARGWFSLLVRKWWLPWFVLVRAFWFACAAEMVQIPAKSAAAVAAMAFLQVKVAA